MHASAGSPRRYSSKHLKQRRNRRFFSAPTHARPRLRVAFVGRADHDESRSWDEAPEAAGSRCPLERIPIAGPDTCGRPPDVPRTRPAEPKSRAALAGAKHSTE